MNNSDSTVNSPENSSPCDNYIYASTIPQPDRYLISVKGQKLNLTRGECVKLYQKLLAIIPNQKETVCATIKEAVCKCFGVSMRLLNSHAKPAHVVLARHTAIYLAVRAEVKPTEICEHFDRHPSLIPYAIRECESRMATNPRLKARIDKLEEQLKELLNA